MPSSKARDPIVRVGVDFNVCLAEGEEIQKTDSKNAQKKLC
jgi:hypothetical protein